MTYTFQVEYYPMIGPVILALRLTVNTPRALSTKANASLEHLHLLGQRRKICFSRGCIPEITPWRNMSFFLSLTIGQPRDICLFRPKLAFVNSALQIYSYVHEQKFLCNQSHDNMQILCSTFNATVVLSKNPYQWLRKSKYYQVPMTAT